MNGYTSVSAAVAGYQKSKLRLLQAKEMLRLAPPLMQEQIAATVAEMEAIMMPFLLAEQAAYEAGEAALPAAGSRRRCGIGKGKNLGSYSQLKAKEVNGDGEVQHGARAYSQPKAMEVNGDGEVLLEAQAHLNGDGEVQTEERVACSPVDSAGRRTKQLLVETRTEERVACSPVDSARRRPACRLREARLHGRPRGRGNPSSTRRGPARS